MSLFWFYVGGAFTALLSGEAGTQRSKWDVIGAILWPLIVLFLLLGSIYMVSFKGKKGLRTFLEASGFSVADSKPPSHLN